MARKSKPRGLAPTKDGPFKVTIQRDVRSGAFVPSGQSKWKLEDAKARFSEVVRRARTEGPQFVTRRGRDAVIVIAAEELENLLPKRPPPLPFVQFMESLHVEGLDLTRDPDYGRDIDL